MIKKFDIVGFALSVISYSLLALCADYFHLFPDIAGKEYLLSFLLYFFFAIFINYICFFFAKGKRGKEEKTYLTFSMFSIDYAFTGFAKNLLLKSESKKTSKNVSKGENSLSAFITSKNIGNLLFTLIVAVVFWIVYLDSDPSCLKNIITLFAVLRFLSRTMEINISFVKDVFEKKHKSDIGKEKRIGLAFVSLIEEGFLFALCYAVLGNCLSWDYMINGLHSLTMSTVATCDDNVAEHFIAIYQTICSTILIALSIANYISNASKKQEDESAKKKDKA